MGGKSAGEKSVSEKHMGEKSVGEKYKGDKSVAEKYMVEQFFGIKDMGHGRQEYG